MAKILIVEDQDDVALLLKMELQSEKHVVEIAADGNLGWELLSTYTYDLIILDWQLPGMSGIEICQKFRQMGATTPVLMLTGRGAITDKTEGLDTGADDYVTKPFDIREVTSRVRALVRRSGGLSSNEIVCGTLVLDLKAQTLTAGNIPVKLLPKELALLEFLMRNPNHVFSQEALLERVWHSDSQVSIGTVYTTIKTLRSKISLANQDCPIETVHGLGYRLVKAN